MFAIVLLIVNGHLQVKSKFMIIQMHNNYMII